MTGNTSALVRPQTHDSASLEIALDALQAQAANFAQRYIRDARVRQGYVRDTQRFAEGLRADVAAGRMGVRQAAQQAVELRNSVMEAARLSSSDLGRAQAEALKATGKGLSELQEYYAQRLHKTSFSNLTGAQRNGVWKEIVASSGRANPRVSATTLRLARLGRGLALAAVAIAVYNIAVAENKSRALAKEGVTVGAGLAGSMAGGAVAGLACGPGAPVCVAIGVFVGGALFAFGADAGFDWLSR